MRVFEPLKNIADSGVPVVVVPGNHERSAIPYPILAAHPGIHIFDGPRTISLNLNGVDVALAGFPCERKNVADRFADLVERTEWRRIPAKVRLLCVHQTVEGARVGPVGYVFRRNHDVIRGREIPYGFAAVLAGHIHRHQVLAADLTGRELAAPVFYPGSIERTSAAEKNETKGYLTLEIDPDVGGGRVHSWTFHDLPARPMVEVTLTEEDLSGNSLEQRLRRKLATLPPDAIVRIRLTSESQRLARFPFTSRQVRAMAPPTMNVDVTRDLRG